MGFHRLNQRIPERSARQAGGELALPSRTAAPPSKQPRVAIHTWALLTATSMLSGCTTLDEAKVVVADATKTAVSYTKKAFEASKPVAEKAVDASKPLAKKALAQLNDLYDQSGGYLSDLFGDPKDRHEAYEKLVQSCPQAIESIKNAAEKTNISANYLLALARQESGCNSKAKSRNTTAAGMFQFVEQTWLVSVDGHGGKYGYQDYAENIAINNRGIASVEPRRLQREILNKRYDPDFSALMAAELAGDNYAYLSRSISRELRPTDLYMAHFLGAAGATEFLVALDTQPNVSAASLFPQAAKANRNVFYTGGSKDPRTVREVHELFRQKIESA
ncbi:MAG: transglycosylase SLT domain-containing protein [Pseudomonadales bacterium]